MAQDVGPEFKSQYCKKRKEERFKEKGKKKKRLCTYKACTLLLEPDLQSILLWLFWR
jgi:hypothetical protein